MIEELDENINKFLDYLKYERKLSNNTYESYRYNLVKFSEYFNTMWKEIEKYDKAAEKQNKK